MDVMDEQSAGQQRPADQQLPWQPVFSAPGHVSEMRCRVCHKVTGMAALVLPCGHHFCRRCLALWVGIYTDMYRGQQGEFPCQLCWKVCVLPSGTSLMEYRQDTELDQLSAQMDHMSVQTEQQTHQQMPSEMTANPMQETCHSQPVTGNDVSLYDHGNLGMGRDSVTALCCSWSQNPRSTHYM